MLKLTTVYNNIYTTDLVIFINCYSDSCYDIFINFDLMNLSKDNYILQ